MKIPDIFLAVQPVLKAFENLSIPYYIGGSVASSIYGMARATMDIDIVADLKISIFLDPVPSFISNFVMHQN